MFISLPYMYKAEKLKQQNVIEYIVYMLQLEKVIRVFDCNLQKISDQFLTQYRVSDEQFQEIRNWYKILILQLQSSNSGKSHFPFIHKLLEELEQIHQQVLVGEDTKHILYQKKYAEVYPIIEELRNSLRLVGDSDISVAIQALHVYVIMKTEQLELSDDTRKSMQSIVEMLEQIAFFFHHHR